MDGSTGAASRTGVIIAWIAAALVAVLIGAGVGGYVWWQGYRASPQYALAQLASAMDRGDWTGVQRYMDVEAVAGQVVDANVSTEMLAQAKAAGIGTATIAALRSTYVQQAVADMKSSTEARGSSGGGGGSGLVGLLAMQPKSVTYSGNDALVTVEPPGPNGMPYTLTFRMQRMPDGSWRVVAIDNLENLPVSAGVRRP